MVGEGGVYRQLGLTPRSAVIRASTNTGNQRVTSQTKAPIKRLRSTGVTTRLAGQGKLDPVVGRDEEIRRVIQILSRRTKNNPVLIGEPVGKTAIVRDWPRPAKETCLKA